MAEIQESGDKKGKGSKQKKMSIRVDFTPMVDMKDVYPGGLYTDGGYEHAADYVLHAVYFAQQASDYGNQYAFQR